MKTRFSILLAVIFLAPLASGHAGETHSAQNSGRSSGFATAEQPCNFRKSDWRSPQVIGDVDVSASERCSPDNPFTVAASVKGTNNVGKKVLMRSGLSRDAVVKSSDLDGDGDPDRINISIEVMGINEFNQSSVDYAIAPGIKPAFWVFAPKTRGMVHDGSRASNLLRMPSPTIRVEEGDRVNLKVHNTHYMPHTVHLHGVDHRFNSSRRGNDGVPVFSEKPIPPGESRTYEFSPDEEGNMMYHCHVVPNVHVLMGLNGMFKVVEEQEDNRVQTLNIGAGKVRHQGSVTGNFSSAYDLVYTAIDRKLHSIPQKFDDTRKVARQINRVYDITDNSADYFLLNGKSFPYTLRDSIINVEKDSRYKLNVLNVGRGTLSLHTHGHKFRKVAVDGVELENPVQRDVLSLTPAQRATLVLNTTVDGLNSYGEGVWIMHDHREEAVTTDGISMGGDISAIVYEDYLAENKMPETISSLKKYFTAQYYEGEIPYFRKIDAGTFGSPPNQSAPIVLKEKVSGKPGRADMRIKMKKGGTVTNQNTEKLPSGCQKIHGEKTIRVKAGEQFADAGETFSYSRKNYTISRCVKTTVVFNNTDEVRHQWMVHGLPEETYPGGMFSIEALGGETVRGTFITPGRRKELNLHCSLPQHQQKGMEGSIKISKDEKAGKDSQSLIERVLSLF
ncbi:MAG: multicopper oxidase domain-containing protein [Candidatus Nanohalobium sp.]